MGNCIDISIEFLNNLVSILFLFIYIPIVFPINCVYNYFSISHPDLFRQRNNPTNHAKKVEKMQEQIRKWNRNGRKNKMCTARSGWKALSVRNYDKSKLTQIKLDLEDIIEIDPTKMTIKVEPGIKMGTLTHKLLPQGWTIPIIPEFDTLTVGGLINGAGLETSSHKYGLFASSCLEYEVVLADGSLVTCSKTENADLFYSLPMAYGTLGFMTSVTFPLIRAGKYVRVEYHAASSIPEAEALLRRKGNEFIEGIAFGKHNSVVMFGNFVDKAESGKVNHVNRWYKHWFYKHVESFLNEKNVKVEYIPTRDYYHRHTKAGFWTITLGGLYQSRIFSFLCGWLFPLNFQLMKLLVPTPKWAIDLAFKRMILQDFVVPLDKLEESLTLSHDLTEVYPIWLCPCKMFKLPGLVKCRGKEDEDYIDVGIYGLILSKKLKQLGNAAEAVKKFEQFTITNIGLQGMYTDCYLTREDFDKMFDRTLYEKLRTQLNCRDAFPDVYEKISVTFKKN